MKCTECYTDKPRITPILEPELCLRNDLQYICSSCGRCMCVDTKRTTGARCLQPFSSMEMAMLYLRSTEVIKEAACGIYEIMNPNTNKKSFIILAGQKDLSEFLSKNPGRFCKNNEPKYRTAKYTPPKKDQVRKLSEAEIQQYLVDQKRVNAKL
jgi:hypothetical protein